MNTRKSVQGLLVAGAILASGAVCAENSGWYAGLGVGQSMIDADAGELDALWASVGVTATSSVDDSDTAWKIFGGYRLTKNIGVEVTYMDYGTISADSTITAPVAGTANIEIDTSAWIADVVGVLPLNDQFELFGKLGVAAWDADVSASAVAGGAAVSESGDEDDTDFHFGVGASYSLMDNVAVRAEWERINDSDGDMDAWTIGAQMSF